MWARIFERTPQDFRAEEKVGVLREVQRAPLFDNLPFLRLKPGDKLLRGPAWRDRRKAEEAHFEKQDSYFVLHKGHYYELETWQEKGALSLHEVTDSVLFDWDVSVQSAALLKNLLRLQRWSIQPQNFLAMREAVREQFPEAWVAEAAPQLREPLVEGEGEARAAIFESLEFDPYENAVFHTRLSIGNSRFLLERRTLIQGPPRIERSEFEGSKPSRGPNAGGMRHQPSPEETALRRLEYKRMRLFQRLIEPFLSTPLPAHITGEPPAPGAGGFGR